MSREQIEQVYSKTIEKMLEVVGQSMADHIGLLGDNAIDIAVNSVEEYLKLLKGLRDEYEKPLSQQSCMSPLLNDSMLIHRNRSSKSRLNLLRNSPELIIIDGSPMGIDGSPMEIDGSPMEIDGSPMEIDRGSLSATRITAIIEETSFLDASRDMDDSTVKKRYRQSRVEDLAVPSNCSQLVKTNDTVPPVLFQINGLIDFDADSSTLTINSNIARSSSGEDTDSTILVNDDVMTTPRPRRVVDTDMTPTNLWNVKLRPGSNRKISEEILREIQRALAADEENE